VRLIEARIGETVRVIGSKGGKLLAARLLQAGVYPDDRIRVLRAAPLGGPLLVEVGGREIALGRAVARRILVELE
jgi:ferrous iron transport protein A